MCTQELYDSPHDFTCELEDRQLMNMTNGPTFAHDPPRES